MLIYGGVGSDDEDEVEESAGGSTDEEDEDAAVLDTATDELDGVSAELDDEGTSDELTADDEMLEAGSDDELTALALDELSTGSVDELEAAEIAVSTLDEDTTAVSTDEELKNSEELDSIPPVDELESLEGGGTTASLSSRKPIASANAKIMIHKITMKIIIKR